MKSLFIIFITILLLFIYSSHFISDAKTLNDIIDQSFQNMVKRKQQEQGQSLPLSNINYIKFDHLKDDQQQEQQQSIDSSDIHEGHQHLPGYNCVHDQIANNLGIKGATFQEMEEISKNRKLLELEQVESGAVEERKPLRFYFDKRYLTNGQDEGACYSVGQIVLLGGGTSRGTCKSDGSVYPCKYTCTANDLLTSNVADLIIKDILTTIQNTLGEMVLVNRGTGNLKLPEKNSLNTKYCDYGYPIPQDYFDVGVPNSDMVVFVTGRPIQSQSTIAYSAPCIFVYGSRPLAATINFNPRYFLPFVSSNSPSNFIFNEYIRVGIHEMTHGLGFTNNFFPFFKDRQNSDSPYTFGSQVGDNVTTFGTTPNGNTWIYNRPGVRTPAMNSFVRGHYNCYSNSSSFQLLEDYGSSGTAGSHWEKRTVGEEYMLGFVSPVFPITNLTLALLFDSSWYDVNNSLAEPFMWGKGLGCEWLEDCNYQSWNVPGYFCDDSTTIRCSPTRVGKGRCNIQGGWANLILAYQHFKDRTIAGDLIADGCPFFDVSGGQYCVDASNSKIANTKINEVYGDDSRCFEYTDTGSNGKSNDQSLACWNTRCVDQVLEVLVDRVWINCNFTNTGKSFKVGTLEFTCPPYFYPCQSNYFMSPPNSSTLIYPGIDSDLNNSNSLFNNANFNVLILLILIITLFN